MKNDDAWKATRFCPMLEKCRGGAAWPDKFHQHIDFDIWKLYKQQYTPHPDDGVLILKSLPDLVKFLSTFDALSWVKPEVRKYDRSGGHW